MAGGPAHRSLPKFRGCPVQASLARARFIHKLRSGPGICCRHALGIAAFPENRPATFSHLQLLQETTKLRGRPIPDCVRDFCRTGTATLRTLRLRLCRDAGARPNVGKRTGAGLIVASYAVAEAVCRPDISCTSGRPVLAGSILLSMCGASTSLWRSSAIFTGIRQRAG